MGQNPKLKVILLTGRTIEQGVGKEHGKGSQDYLDSAAICFIDPQDLKKLDIKEKGNVLVSTENGSVVVKALKSTRAPHQGIVYMPYGPWANMIVDVATESAGMPSMKGIPAEIISAPETAVFNLAQLLTKQFRKE